jgi:hypothetical protein
MRIRHVVSPALASVTWESGHRPWVNRCGDLLCLNEKIPLRPRFRLTAIRRLDSLSA